MSDLIGNLLGILLVLPLCIELILRTEPESAFFIMVQEGKAHYRDGIRHLLKYMIPLWVWTFMSYPLSEKLFIYCLAVSIITISAHALWEVSGDRLLKVRGITPPLNIFYLLEQRELEVNESNMLFLQSFIAKLSQDIGAHILMTALYYVLITLLMGTVLSTGVQS